MCAKLWLPLGSLQVKSSKAIKQGKWWGRLKEEMRTREGLNDGEKEGRRRKKQLNYRGEGEGESGSDGCGLTGYICRIITRGSPGCAQATE